MDITATEIFTILGGIAGGFAIAAVGIHLGSAFITQRKFDDYIKSMDKQFEGFQNKVAETIVDTLVKYGVIKNETIRSVSLQSIIRDFGKDRAQNPKIKL